MAFVVLDTHISGRSQRRLSIGLTLRSPDGGFMSLPNARDARDARVMPYRPKSHTLSHAFESIDAFDSILSPNWRNRTQIKAKKIRKSPQFVIIMWAV